MAAIGQKVMPPTPHDPASRGSICEDQRKVSAYVTVLLEVLVLLEVQASYHRKQRRPILRQQSWAGDRDSELTRLPMAGHRLGLIICRPSWGQAAGAPHFSRRSCIGKLSSQ